LGGLQEKSGIPAQIATGPTL